MNDVFISYSRRDKDFVERLLQVVQQHHSVWIDWEDIPLSGDWWKEIQKGIEEASVFIFIVSEASVQSPICNFEVSHAIAAGKRIVPVLKEPVDQLTIDDFFVNYELNEMQKFILDGRSMPQVARDSWRHISRHNWLDFQKDEQFDESCQTLLKSLNTDFDRAQVHARILTRAIDWENSKRSDNKLLNAKETDDAEAWLSQEQVGTYPQSTPLQKEYILASRARQRRRQRSLVSAMTVIVAIVSVLAIAAIVLFFRAEANATEAENQAQTAVAAESTSQRNADEAETQAAFAAQQQERAENQAQTAVAAESTSQRNAEEAETQAAIATREQGIAEVQSTIAFEAQLTSQANAEEASTQAAIATREQGRAENQAQTAVAAESTSQRNAEEAETQAAIAAQQQAIAEQQAQTAVAAEATSQSNAELALAERDRASALSLSAQAELALVQGNVDQARILALAAYNNFPPIYEIERVLANSIIEEFTSEANRVHAPSDILHLSYSPDGTRYVSADDSGFVVLWATDGSLRRDLSGHRALITDATFSADSQLFATTDVDGVVFIRDARSGDVITSADFDERINGALWIPDSDLIALYGDEATLYTWHIVQLSIQPLNLAHNDSIVTADITDTGMFATGSLDGVVSIWSPDLELLANFEDHLVNTNPELSQSYVSAVAFSPDGSRLATAGSDRLIRIWDTASLSEIAQLQGNLLPITELIWSASGEYLVSVDNDLADILGDDPDQIASTAQIWDMNTYDNLFTVFEHDGYITDAAFSPDAKRLMTVGVDGFINIFDTQSGGLLLSFENAGRLLQVDWHPSDSEIVAGNAEGVVRTWQLWESIDSLAQQIADCCLVREVTVEEARIFGLPAPVSAPPPETFLNCEDAPPSRLYTGAIGIVSGEDPRPINVRPGPGLNFRNIDAQLTFGQYFRVIEDGDGGDIPVCSDGFAWYPIRYGADGNVGWIAEGEITDDGTPLYYLSPVPSE